MNLPARDKLLRNLKGERWEAIPGYEGFYDISNYGRVKSLPHAILYQNGRVIYKKGRISLAGISSAPNYFSGDYTYQLSILLYKNGKKKAFSIGRLVFWLFNRPFDWEDKTLMVISKDGNGLNCNYKNLVLVSSIDRQKRIYARSRYEICFNWLDMKAIAQRDLERRKQKITQYYKTGKFKRSFPSIKEAAKHTGISTGNIDAVLNGRQQTAGGYVWRRGVSKEPINLDGYFDQWRTSYKEKRGFKVKQVSKTGKTIKEFPSITDAALANSITIVSVWRALKKPVEKGAGGCFWYRK